MNTQQTLELIARTEAAAKASPFTPIKVRAGLYYIANRAGDVYQIEHVTRAQGFDVDEWWMGPSNDPGENQYRTMGDAVHAFTSVHEIDLTDEQTDRLNWLAEMLPAVNGDGWDIKRWQVQNWNDGVITLNAEVGEANDDYSEAMFKRTSYFIFVGSRGGLWSFDILPNGATTARGARSERIEGEDVVLHPLQ